MLFSNSRCSQTCHSYFLKPPRLLLAISCILFVLPGLSSLLPGLLLAHQGTPWMLQQIHYSCRFFACTFRYTRWLLHWSTQLCNLTSLEFWSNHFQILPVTKIHFADVVKYWYNTQILQIYYLGVICIYLGVMQNDSGVIGIIWYYQSYGRLW